MLIGSILDQLSVTLIAVSAYFILDDIIMLSYAVFFFFSPFFSGFSQATFLLFQNLSDSPPTHSDTSEINSYKACSNARPSPNLNWRNDGQCHAVPFFGVVITCPIG